MNSGDLRKEIEEKKAILANLENVEKRNKRNDAIKDLSEFTNDEKIDIFNRLYKYSLADLEELEKKGYIDEDSENYAYETLLTIIARNQKKYWEYRNSL